MNILKSTVIAFLLSIVAASGAFAQQNNAQLVGAWKLTKSETLDKIRNSEQYWTMSEKHREAFDAHTDLVMKVSEYNFKANHTLEYMDVEQTLGGVIVPVKRNASWSLQNDIVTIKETDRPYTRQMKIVTLDENTLVVHLLVDGNVMDGKVFFSSVK